MADGKRGAGWVRRCAWGLLSLSLLVAPLSAQPGGAARSTQPDSSVAAPADGTTTNTTVTASALTRLAEAGKFDRVLASASPLTSPEGDANIVRLLSQIKRFEEQKARQATNRRASFDKAMAAMGERAKAGRMEDALAAAIQAHSLSDDPPATLRDPRIAAVVKSTEAAIERSRKAEDWVEVASLYRALDVLFDETAEYRESFRRASRHVSVLRVYAPAELEKLLVAREERLDKLRPATQPQNDKAGAASRPDGAAIGLDDVLPGDAVDADDVAEPGSGRNPKKRPIKIEHERWQDKLVEVEPSMLNEALRSVARRHVSVRGYSALLRGAADALSIIADTRALATTFPSLKNPSKLQRFREMVLTIKHDIIERKADLDSVDASVRDQAANTLIEKMLAANTQTVELPQAVIVYEMAEGAIDNLDEFSAVIWPSERDMFRRNFDGDFFGVGIQISVREERITVVSPLEDTPAQRAGIRAGDIIAAVNGRDTAGWSVDQAVREITDRVEGTQVTLGIERRGVDGLLEFKLKRAKIPITSVYGWQHRPAGGWDYYIDPEMKIGYVRLTQFMARTADDLDAAINQMEAEGGINALILDLRFNPGGLLTAAVEVANRFIPGGTLVSTVGPPDTKSQEFKAKPSHAHKRFPLVVLINQGSASASEIVSGALQDYRRALVVGTRSFGKGSVQDVMAIDPGRGWFDRESSKAYLKLTTQYYRLPRGRIIHRQPQATEWGIDPDLKISMTAQQTIGAMELRQQADVLHSPDEVLDPKKPQPTAQEIVTRGADPQLISALLALKTRLLAPQIMMSAKNAAR